MKCKLRLFSICILILAFPVSAAAQLEISPDSMLFGRVEIGGESPQMQATIYNMGAAQPLTVTLTGSTDFSIISSVPTSISQGQIVFITVEYSPSVEGFVSADLTINGTVIPIEGEGVAVEPPTSPTVAEILAFFDLSVFNGTLVGDGPGNSADGRRGALRNMIEAAGDLIEDGAVGDACQQLLDAHQRCDVLPRPPEFVAGSATGTLAGMIIELMGTMGCE